MEKTEKKWYIQATLTSGFEYENWIKLKRHVATKTGLGYLTNRQLINFLALQTLEEKKDGEKI